MTSLALALRALWSRRGVSLAVVLVAVFVVASATAGPVYLRAAGESVLQDVLADAGPVSTGVGATLAGSGTERPDVRLQEAATALLGGSARFGGPVRGLEQQEVVLPAVGGGTVLGRYVDRDGACAALQLDGRCPARAGEAVVSRASTDRLARALPGLTVVGTYVTDPQDPAWSGRGYFVQPGQADPQGRELVDAVFVGPGTLGSAERVVGTVDVASSPGALRLADADGVVGEATAAVAGLQARAPDAVATTGLPELVERAQRSAGLLRAPVLLVVLQLLVLSWLVLAGVVAGSVDARGPEIALAKLRGLPGPATVAFGLLEPLLLLLLAVPAGVLLGLVTVRVLAGRVLSDDAVVVLPASALGAAALAVLGGAVAAAVAARATLARPALEQFRRTAPRATRRAAVLDVAVLVLTAAGLVQLVVSGAVRGGDVDPVALLTPGLLSLAVALLVARVLPAACRALLPVTRGRTGLGLFLAVRQVARRPAGVRAVVVLVVAFGLATFSVSGWSVARDNREARALTVVGAPAVASVVPPRGTDLADVVARVDPDGRWAMAVAETEQLSSSQAGRRLLAVDTPRLAAVAQWRADFAGPSLRSLQQRLRPPAAPPVLVRGRELGVRVGGSRLEAVPRVPVSLTAGLRDSSGLLRTADLGVLPAGPGELRIAVPCADGCRLEALRVARTGFATVTGSFTLTGLSVDGAPLDAGLDDPDRWRAVADEGDTPTLRAGSGLVVGVAASEASDPGVGPADAPAPLPAVVTPSVGAGPGALEVVGLSATALQVQPVAQAVALPRGQADGVLVDRTYALRSLRLGSSRATEQVWLGQAAPADAVERLRAAGVQVRQVERAADLEATLARQGPALALLLFLLGAAAAALLAAGGTVLNLYLLGRRRAGELSAMRVLGIGSGTLRRALLLEQALLIGTGALAGVGAGLVGALLALPSVPEFDEVPVAPPLLFVPSARVVGGLVAVTVLLLGLAVTAAVVALVRQARLDRLREAPS